MASKLNHAPIRYIRELGEDEAYVLSLLAFLQSKATNTRYGELWFYMPYGRRSSRKANDERYRPLTDYVPWLGKSQLCRIINKLEAKGYIEVGRGWNQERYDKTNWYHVPEKVCKICANKYGWRFFNPADAETFGLSGALVLNVLYRDYRLMLKDGFTRLKLNRSALHRETGIPIRTLPALIKRLEASKVISTAGDGGIKLLVDNPCTMKGRGYGRERVFNADTIAITEYDCSPHSNRISIAARSLVENAPEAKPERKTVSRRRGAKPVDRDAFTTRYKKVIDWQAVKDASDIELNRLDMDIDYHYSGKRNTLLAIARHLGKPASKFAKRIMDQDESDFTLNLTAEDSPELSKYHLYCSSYSLKDGKALMNHDRFTHDILSDEWNKGCAYYHPELRDKVVMSFRVGVEKYVMYQAESYNGEGGGYLKAAGLAWEPLENWLKAHDVQDAVCIKESIPVAEIVPTVDSHDEERKHLAELRSEQARDKRESLDYVVREHTRLLDANAISYVEDGIRTGRIKMPSRDDTKDAKSVAAFLSA
jgi:hypothetical protein